MVVKVASLQNPDGILAKGLLELTDDHWRHVRASLTPTFSAQKLKLVELINFKAGLPRFLHLQAFMYNRCKLLQFQKQITKCADQLIHHLQEMCDLDQEFEAKE